MKRFLLLVKRFLPFSFYIGTFIGFILFAGGKIALDYTNTTEFCVSCHSMQYPMAEWEGSKHFSNVRGVRAGCADCHVPKGSFELLKAKLFAARDVYGEIIGKITDEDSFETHRLDMAQRVWAKMEASDSASCRSCHTEKAWDIGAQTKNAQMMHKLMQETGQTCINCHKGIAHFKPEIEVDDTAATAELAQYAGKFSEQDKVLYSMKISGFSVDDKESGRLMPFARLQDWQHGDDQRVAATIRGWQQEGAESVIYTAPGKRIIQAILEAAAIEKLVVYQSVEDSQTDSVWREVELAISVPVDQITANVTALDSYANNLGLAHCSSCHAPIAANHFTANQWPSIIKSMQKRTALNTEQLQLLTLYQQNHAKDTSSNKDSQSVH